MNIYIFINSHFVIRRFNTTVITIIVNVNNNMVQTIEFILRVVIYYDYIIIKGS